jgi:hypothetical protein
MLQHMQDELYNEMEKIEHSQKGRVLYFDTDSIIFVHREGWYIPQLGDFLGQMTDEIWGEFKDEGAKMVNFSSCGPKNYGYMVKFPNGDIKTKVKTKGIKLSEVACKEINFDTLMAFSKSYVDDNPQTLMVPQVQFRSDKAHIVYTVHMEKEYKVVSTKRRKINNSTMPYGTKEQIT